jgi:hypothetical protein
VARLVGISRPAVWRWQQRFAEEGLDGLRAVQRLWDAHCLRTFKKSAFADKVVGLYMEPSCHAVVLSINEIRVRTRLSTAPRPIRACAVSAPL